MAAPPRSGQEQCTGKGGGCHAFFHKWLFFPPQTAAVSQKGGFPGGSPLHSPHGPAQWPGPGQGPAKLGLSAGGICWPTSPGSTRTAPSGRASPPSPGGAGVLCRRGGRAPSAPAGCGGDGAHQRPGGGRHGQLALTFLTRATSARPCRPARPMCSTAKSPGRGYRRQMVNLLRAGGGQRPHRGIFPVYPLTAGITNRFLTGLVRGPWPACPRWRNLWGRTSALQYDLAPVQAAYRDIHFPPDWQALARPAAADV